VQIQFTREYNYQDIRTTDYNSTPSESNFLCPQYSVLPLCTAIGLGAQMSVMYGVGCGHMIVGHAHKLRSRGTNAGRGILWFVAKSKLWVKK
jgi:hypothetical protein